MRRYSASKRLWRDKPEKGLIAPAYAKAQRNIASEQLFRRCNIGARIFLSGKILAPTMRNSMRIYVSQALIFGRLISSFVLINRTNHSQQRIMIRNRYTNDIPERAGQAKRKMLKHAIFIAVDIYVILFGSQIK